MVLASILGVSLFLGGTAFGLLIVVLFVVVGRRRTVDDASLVGVVLAGSFALGILLSSARSGGSKELSGFLVGSILTVTPSDLWTTAAVGLALLVALFLAHKELVLTAFDPGGTAAAGYRLRLVDLGVLALVGSGVVGLGQSATYDIAAGGAIALTAAAAFALSFLLTSLPGMAPAVRR